jgi:hypothetical protein
MNTPEIFHIYNEAKLDDQISDKCTVKYNVIFDTVIHKTHTEGIHRCNFLYLPGTCSVTNCYARRTHAYAEPSQYIEITK